MNTKLSLLSGCSLLAAIVSAQTQRPNVIVLLGDDVGSGDLSCYKGKVSTPHIDRLAARGTMFTDAHAAAATSTPSRYGLLTGQYPFRRTGTDVADGNAEMVIRPHQYTLADMFKEAGYATAAIGKWHLGLGSHRAQQDWNGTIDATPADIGFDYSCIMAATADRVPCVFIENGSVRNYDPTAPIEVSYVKNYEGEPTGKTHPHLLKLQPSHGHDMSIVNGISRIGYMKGGGSALWQDENIADSIAHFAIDWVERHLDENARRGEQQPFFMYLCTNDIHVPRWPHSRFVGRSGLGLRGDAILQFDETVGRVMEALEKRGIADNTLIILSSDNGAVLDDGYADQAEELKGDHRENGMLRGGKYSAYEAGSTVPFIVSWPAGRVPQGKTSKALVSQIDAIRSLAVVAKGNVADSLATDSRDQHATWFGCSDKSREYSVAMAYNRSVSIRTKDWKYIPPTKGRPMVGWGPKIETGFSSEPQLYDMKKSVEEQENVAKKYPKVLRRLQQKLSEVVGAVAR